MMDKHEQKSLIGRYRQWQHRPEDYSFSSTEPQHCYNCGNDYVGNYCPYCSQKAGVGPVNWSSVRQSVMDVWGLGSRSLPRTIWHLLLRPGYLIGDYIDGKRQVSFPPVKMLFAVAVAVVFFIYYLVPFFFGAVDFYQMPGNMLPGYNQWNQGHFAWAYFFMALLFVLPTWVMFRCSPLRTRHTLPQGFFIQIFMLVLNLFVTTFLLSPLMFVGYIAYLGSCMMVLLVYFVIAYKQLFGYGIWGSLWRMLFVVGSGIYMIAALVFAFFDTDIKSLSGQLPPGFGKYDIAVSMACLSLLILGVGWVVNLIVTKWSRRQVKSAAEN